MVEHKVINHRKAQIHPLGQRASPIPVPTACILPAAKAKKIRPTNKRLAFCPAGMKECPIACSRKARKQEIMWQVQSTMQRLSPNSEDLPDVLLARFKHQSESISMHPDIIQKLMMVPTC